MGIKLTHQQFLDKLPENREYIVIGEYKKQSEKILIWHKYGNCLISCQSLIEGVVPSTKNAINPTDFFKNKLRDVNPHYDSFSIEGDYIEYNTPLIVSNKYGKCLVKPSSLLNGYNLFIRSAIDPHNYFCNMVKERNSYYKNGEIEIISKFVNDSQKIIIKTARGVHLITPYSLFQDNLPNINTALDKNTYLKNQFEEIFNNNEYNYSKINFISYKDYVTIGCNTCGKEFSQSPDHHCRGYGCPDCANQKRGFKLSNWLMACPGEKGKFYVLHCSNNEESFIKIGITCQTVDIRYNSIISMPYNYKVLNVVEDDDRNNLWKLESSLKKKLKLLKLSYNPLIYFAGATTEVFTYNSDTINKINEEINNFNWN